MNNEFPVRIILADSCSLIMSGIEKALKADNVFNIIASAKNGRELVEKYFKHLPDLIITCVSMPELSGVNALKKIKKISKKTKVLFLSECDSEAIFRICVKAGGLGLISKAISEIELINAVRTVFTGNYYYRKPLNGNELYEIMNRKYSNEKMKGIDCYPIFILSKKEMEYFRLIGQGLSITEICDKLKKNKRIFHFHQKNIMEKLEIKTSQKLIWVAAGYLLEESLGKKTYYEA